MPTLHRTAALAFAALFVSSSASANILPLPVDASVADAKVVVEEDAQAVDGSAPPPEVDGSDGDDAGATAVGADAGSTSLTIPSATGVQFTSPDTSSDDGCNASSASAGSVSAFGLLAVLGLVRSRRRRRR